MEFFLIQTLSSQNEIKAWNFSLSSLGEIIHHQTLEVHQNILPFQDMKTTSLNTENLHTHPKSQSRPSPLTLPSDFSLSKSDLSK